MTDRTLSPTAQTIYDAFNRVGLYNEPSFETDRKALAAALRAAERQLGYELLGVRTIDCSQLLLIAEELEGIKYGTYRCNLTDRPKD